MFPPVVQDNRGHTLVEMMVAMLILLVGLLGLIEAINLGIRTNLGNKLRNDAMSIADEQISMERVKSFDSINSENIAYAIRMVNGFVNYSVTKTVTNIGAVPTSKKIDVKVQWRQRGNKKSVSVSTIISKE